MKKNSWLFIAVAVMALLAVPYIAAAAPVKMIFTGSYQIVGVASDNVHDFIDQYYTYDGEGEPTEHGNDKTSYVMQRFRLTTIAATENVKGVLGFEMGWDEWGKSYSTQSGLGHYSMGGSSATGGDTGIMADTPHTNIEVRFAYVDFKVPGTGLSIIAGKAPLYAHQQLVLTAAAPAPGIQAKYDFGNNAKLKVFWAKMVEGTDAFVGNWRGNGDSDYDFWYAEFTKKLEACSFGLYTAYGRDAREQGTSLGSLLYNYSAIKPWNTTANWFGGFTNFKIGKVALDLHGVYSKWDFDAVAEDGFGDLPLSFDGSGWYGRIKASMNAGPVILNAGTLYSSGDDDLTDNDVDVFAYVEGPSRYPAISLIAAGPNLYFWGNGVAAEEYSAVCLPPSGTHMLGHWFTNLGVTYPLGKVKLVGEYWYLRTAEDPADARTYDDPWRDEVIGHEFDFEIHYALTPNLTLQGEFDYLLAGDFNKPDESMDADDAWLVAWGIVYKF